MKLLTLMETYACVVEAGSFTLAAERLGHSKSFVSKQVSQLESELGTRLLYRTTRKLSLSDEGGRFYNHCKLIMTEAENARSEIIESQINPRGRIRITVPQSLIISGVGEILIDFQRQYPEVDLEVIVSGRVENLVEEGIDIALRVGLLEDSTLICRRLADFVFQVVAAPQYIAARGEPADPVSLTRHNCLVYGDSRISRNWPLCTRNGEPLTVKVQGNLTTNDGHLILNAALKGLGIAFGPSIMFAKPLLEGQLCLLLSEYYQQPSAISVVYPLNRNLSRRVRLLIDFLAEHMLVQG